jgi:hypothetical protein
MRSLSPLLLVALAILLIDAGRDLLRSDYWDGAGTILVVVVVFLAFRSRRPSSAP